MGECVDGKCRCKSGHIPTYLPAPILSSRPPTLVFCQSLSEVAVVLKSNAAMANASGLDVVSDQNSTAGLIPIDYYPRKRYTTKSLDAGYDWYRMCLYLLCWCINLPDVQINQSGGGSRPKELKNNKKDSVIWNMNDHHRTNC